MKPYPGEAAFHALTADADVTAFEGLDDTIQQVSRLQKVGERPLPLQIFPQCEVAHTSMFVRL
jgi:hypothetical protein